MLGSPIRANRYGDRKSCEGEPLLGRPGARAPVSDISAPGSFGWPGSDFGASQSQWPLLRRGQQWPRGSAEKAPSWNGADARNSK